MTFEQQKCVKPIERKIAKVKEGDKFVANENEYTVVKVYSHHVLCVTKKGINECFTVGDLVMMGKESQLPNEENCFTV